MDLHIWVTRLKSNYNLLNNLYKQGRFEEEVKTTQELAEESRFYNTSDDVPETKQSFKSVESINEPLGRMRRPNDLQWATSNLRELAQFLFENYKSEVNLPPEDIESTILYYYRTISLSYEVDDYFLSVNSETSTFLTNIAKKISDNIEDFADQFEPYFSKDKEEYRELLKQILIVALCGVNEYYRQHLYDEGLVMARRVKQLLFDLPRRLPPSKGHLSKGHWSGLKGLCSYVTGKILTAQGNFSDAEQEFLNSVEAYSESIWQKERNFSRHQEKLREFEIRFRSNKIKEEKYNKYVQAFTARKQDHELSRAVALRRSGLASSFGYGFQALVMGKVKDAIRLSSLSRGIVNWNTGKIYSSYVDLIYYSAKRAENSSDRKALVEIQRNLKRCFRVFQDLIPAAHYKNRALFQIALVYHYLARWYKERGLAIPEKAPKKARARQTRKWNFSKAKFYWESAAKHLLLTINDENIKVNKRLRAESMAILGHAWSNLGLLEKDFNRSGIDLLNKAEGILDTAWEEAEQLPQIKCEVGLAKAAAGKTKVDYLLSDFLTAPYLDETDKKSPTPANKKIRDEIRLILNASRQILHDICELNQNNSMRVQATAYLRLTELALLQKETRIQAPEYYEEFMKISSQVEHEFCHRWARDLENKILILSNSFTVVITPGVDFNKQDFDQKLEKYYTDYAVNYAAKQIFEDSAKGNFTERSSLSSYLTAALHKNFGILSKTAGKWIDEYDMFEHLQRICYAAKGLPPYAPQSKKGKEKKAGV